MTTLGELLACAQHTALISRWLSESGPATAEALSRAQALTGETPDEFALAAVAELSITAGDEEWTLLISRLHAARDPALTCLETMVRWRLAVCTGAAGVSSSRPV